MKHSNWLNLDHHEFVAVDLEDGRRLELQKGDKLILSVDSITLRLASGVDYIIPTVKVSQIIKKLRKRYL